jgi:hypothetical protein
MFKASDPEHAIFTPVREWISKGQGKFIMGGKKYASELLKVKSIIPLLAELERRGKIIRKSDVDVDAEEAIVKQIEPAKNFDDPHLVALVRLSGCKLICIRDPRSHQFLRAARLYNSPGERPKLYTRAKNIGLLCPSNVASCCK